MKENLRHSDKTSHFLDTLLRLTHPIRQRIWPVSPSSKAGMGAVNGDPTGGISFRVWAPYAEQLFVTGSFNKWSRFRTPLAREENGYWSADVSDAKPGDAYKFTIRHGGKTLLRIDPYAQDVDMSSQDGVVRDVEYGRLHDTFRLPSHNELVIYELHVGTFAETENGPPGDFAGVIEKLPYLQWLGVNAIELMPVAAFSGDFSWGYNPAHLFAVSRVYGGAAELQRLIHTAHQYGIAVIVDVVYNHFGPQDLSLWQFDGWHEDDMGGIYFYNDWRSKTPWADTRPDYGRSEVRQFIRDNVLMWVEQFGVDGLRWDATSYIRNAHGHDGDPGSDIPEGWEMMAAINDEVNGRFPHKIQIAEDLQGNAWITKPSADGGAAFHSQWDTNFVHPIRHAIIAPEDAERDMFAVRDALTFRYNDAVFDRVIYTESHDEVANGKARVPEEIAPGEEDNWFAQKRALLGAALVFTAPGIPMLFQGQEFMQTGWFDDHQSLDWQKAKDNQAFLACYRHLIHLRRNWFGHTGGLTGVHINVYHVDNEQKWLAFHRWQHGGPGDDVVVIVNFSHTPLAETAVGFPAAGSWHVRLNSDEEAANHEQAETVVTAVVGEMDGLGYQGCVAIAPYSFLILSQE